MVLRWLSDGGGSVSLELWGGGAPGVGCPVRIQILAILCSSSTISKTISLFWRYQIKSHLCVKFF